MQHVPPLSFLADRFNGKSIAAIAAEAGTTPAAVVSLLADTAHAILADVAKPATTEPFTFTLAEDMPADEMTAPVLAMSQMRSLPFDQCAGLLGRSPENAAALLALYAEAIQGSLRAMGYPATVADAFAAVRITPPEHQGEG